MTVFIKMGQPLNSPALWGDFHFAYSLKDSLKRRGIPGRVLFYEDLMLKVDVEIVLLGLNMAHYRPARDNYSVAWLISHPEQNVPEVLSSFNTALVCSRPLSRAWGFEYFPQAFDSRTFGNGATEPANLSNVEFPIVFVGNARDESRIQLLNALGDAFEGVHVWGNFYRKNPHITYHAPVLPNAVDEIYRRARIVIGHHLEPARRQGMINDRVYSVIASGAFLISDAVSGINAEFPDLVTYDSPEEAVRLCRYYLDRDEDRVKRAKSCTEQNRQNSFDERAFRLEQLFPKSL